LEIALNFKIIMKNYTLQISIFAAFFSLIAFAQDVTVAAGGQLYISPAAYVVVTNSGNVTISSTGELIMDSVSNDFSDFMVDGGITSTGTAEYRHFTGSSATRDLVSPPVNGQTFMSFASDNNTKIAGGSITTANLMYGPFDNPNGVEYGSSETTPLAAGIGFRAGSAGGQTLAYKGAIATTDVTATLTYGSGQFKGANLVGNPFTTHIKIMDLVSSMNGNAAIDQSFAAIYGYDGSVTTNPNTWSVFNSMNSVVTDLITPGQGFFIVSSVAGGPFVFPKSATNVSPNPLDNFLQVPRLENTASSFKLKLAKGPYIHETSLYFIDENGSRGLDVTYDAGAFGSADIGTHLVEDSSGVNFVMQVLSTDDLTATDYEIAVEVRVAAGQEATISIDELNVPPGTIFYLDDTELNIQTPLIYNHYTFTPSSNLSGIGRFFLRTTSNTFSSPYTALDSVEILSLTATRKVVVQGQLRNNSTLILYDIRGRVVQTHQLQASKTRHEIDVSKLSSAVYVAKLNNKYQSKTTKLVIK
jgi:hypothetical protein